MLVELSKLEGLDGWRLGTPMDRLSSSQGPKGGNYLKF
jgi:hypothetical protein